MSIVSALGIVFAIVGLCDLLQKKNRQSFFNILLASLLLFDFILLLSYLIKSIVTYFVAIPIEYFSFYPIVVCSSLRFSLTCVIFMTVALSYSRSKAVEKPFETRINAMESDSEKIIRFSKLIVPVLLVSIILTIPWFFEYKVSETKTSLSGQPKLVPSDFRWNPLYSLTFIAIYSLLLLALFPTISLIILSCKIYTAIQKSYKSVSTKNQTDSNSRIFNNKCLDSKTILAISVLFLISSIPRILSTTFELILQVIFLSKQRDMIVFIGCNINTSYWTTLLINLDQLFAVINSSIHLFLYKRMSKIKSYSISRHVSRHFSQKNNQLSMSKRSRGVVDV